MAFRLDPAEAVHEGVRRIAHEQLARSIAGLAEGADGPDGAASASSTRVHAARKSMKRLRALVRLVRGPLGRRRYALENATYRDAARRLARLRDATVLVATFDQLVAGLDGEAAAGDFAPLRDLLVHRRDRAYGPGDGADPALDRVADDLRQADCRIDDWPLPDAGWELVAAGLQRVYRRGRAEFAEACWRPSVAALHQWRKRVKYLWYHAQVLEPLWPGPFAAWQAELDRLGDLLGQDHDLAVLAGVVRGEGAGPSALDPGQTAALLGHIGRRRHHLQAEATMLGMRIYAERPRDLRRRLRGYWRAWSEERLRCPAPVPQSPGPSHGAGDPGIPEPLADICSSSAESPRWHPDAQCLYWVDVATGWLQRYDPAAGAGTEVFRGEAIGGFTVQADGSLLLFMAGGAIAVWGEGRPLQPVVEEIGVEGESRFGAVTADPEGRVFCSTVPRSGASARLYRLDPDGTLTELLEEVGVLYGMDFAPDGRCLYCADAQAQRIWRFDYDATTGELANRRAFADSGGEQGPPGDLAIDAEGGVWCAYRGGSCVSRYRPDGSRDRRVEFPDRRVSGACFGGPVLDDLYVTAGGGRDGASEGDGAGALFRLRPGVAGAPPFRSQVAP